MKPDEGDYILLAEAMNFVAVALLSLRALKPVTQPTIRNPLLNSVMILAQAWRKIADCVALGDQARVAEGLIFMTSQVSVRFRRLAVVADETLRELSVGVRRRQQARRALGRSCVF